MISYKENHKDFRFTIWTISVLCEKINDSDYFPSHFFAEYSGPIAKCRYEEFFVGLNYLWPLIKFDAHWSILDPWRKFISFFNLKLQANRVKKSEKYLAIHGINRFLLMFDRFTISFKIFSIPKKVRRTEF